MAYVQRDPSGNFHLCFRFGGHRFKRSLHTKYQRKADAAAVGDSESFVIEVVVNQMPLHAFLERLCQLAHFDSDADKLAIPLDKFHQLFVFGEPLLKPLASGDGLLPVRPCSHLLGGIDEELRFNVDRIVVNRHTTPRRFGLRKPRHRRSGHRKDPPRGVAFVRRVPKQQRHTNLRRQRVLLFRSRERDVHTAVFNTDLGGRVIRCG
jgi:hypothetical protein